jgi:glycosyltransferase involved in cell wall biosynthesis
MRKVIFFQSKFPTSSTEFQNLAERWNDYGRLIHNITGGQGIYIFSLSLPLTQQQLSLNRQYIHLLTPGKIRENLFEKLFTFSKEVASSDTRLTIVCGDNHLSLLYAIYLKFRNKAKVRIQVQFHGDTYSYKFNTGFRGFLRVSFSRLAIRAANSVRVVSQFQVDEILSFSPSSKDKFVLAPIPIDYSRVPRMPGIKTVDVAFVGRFHEERGIDELIQVVQRLNEADSNLKIKIVGDGPLMNHVKLELGRAITNGSVILTGYLSSNEIMQVYSQAKILLSTAPREGYGLTLREAALSNLFVVAHASKGAVEAQHAFPKRIWTYSNSSEAVDLVLQIIRSRRDYGEPEDLKLQQSLDSQSLERLVTSWVAN